MILESMLRFNKKARTGLRALHGLFLEFSCWVDHRLKLLLEGGMTGKKRRNLTKMLPSPPNWNLDCFHNELESPHPPPPLPTVSGGSELDLAHARKYGLRTI